MASINDYQWLNDWSIIQTLISTKQDNGFGTGIFFITRLSATIGCRGAGVDHREMGGLERINNDQINNGSSMCNYNLVVLMIVQ